MNGENLDRLIERYYNGESTEAEEQALRELFQSDDAPEGYDDEKALFGYYESAGVIPAPSFDFESRIIAGIDASEKESQPMRRRRYPLPWLSAAATVLIFLGSWFFLIHRSESEDTYSDPEIAYAETMKILMDVSTKMNHGARALEPIGKIDQMASQSLKTVSRSTGRIGKNLEDIGTILEPLGKASK
jgi:hypothetical protein